MKIELKYKSELERVITELREGEVIKIDLTKNLFLSFFENEVEEIELSKLVEIRII